MTLNLLLENMWKDFVDLNPNALTIRQFFKETYGEFQNDHIALRTFNHPKVNLDVFEAFFKNHGYSAKDTYTFKEKKLFAKHFEHENPLMPKIFVSELLLEQFSTNFQKTINSLIEQIPESVIQSDQFPIAGRPWNIDSKTYQTLKEESEYGAWLSALGFRVNHFTVFVNSLSKDISLKEVNQKLKTLDFKLNDSGGEIKGTPEQMLEQSSTRAHIKKIAFSDGSFEIPTCYYEFAKRYPDHNGNIYNGFIASSADKIFESTDTKY